VAGWEGGDFDAIVRGGGLRAPYATRLLLRDTVTIDIPARTIRGRIRDERGEAVSGATVSLRTGVASSRRTVRGTSAEDGSFDFAGVDAGQHTIFVLAPGHLRPEPVTVEMAEADEVRDVTIVARAGYVRDVAVVDTHGEPVAAAALVCAVGDRVRSITDTNRSGRATLATPADERSMLFTLTPSGAIAMQRLETAANDETGGVLRIVVPQPTASLEIETKTTTGAPMPAVGLLLRINGEIVPPEVGREVEKTQGATLTTGDDGIARLPHLVTGTYELWPYTTEGEVQEILASASVLAAPVVVNVVTGSNRATIRFQSRQ